MKKNPRVVPPYVFYDFFFLFFSLCLLETRPLFTNSQLETQFRRSSMQGDRSFVLSTELGKLINIIDSSR